ncbi:MAG: LysM peptidoglycan-binding domain-containing protein [Prosthecobacter sp.]|jgi:LysM repeat protein|nr:LysM peptidoglycan-binding domain-containing protein [Prosthecobacter sp.]
MKKKQHKLLLNLVEGDRHKHRVAMVNEEAEWNQQEPNSGMARMFFVMLLLHVVVIGGIIVYDWLNGEESPPPTVLSTSASTTPSALPPPAVNAADAAAQIPIEECSTYEWKTGDSLDSVAAKLGVSKEVLIRMNMLDKGTQLEANSIIRYPKQPVVRALGIGVAGAQGAQPVPPASIAAAEAPMALTAPGEQTFSFSPTIEKELTPTPSVQESPPPATMQEPSGPPSVPAAIPAPDPQPQVPAVVKKAPPKVQDAPPAKAEPKPAPKPTRSEDEVPKAIPVKRYQPPAVVEKPAAKKAAPEPTGRTYTVKSGETLYSIAIRNGTTVKALQTANKITKPESLREGMKIVIPAK